VLCTESRYEDDEFGDEEYAFDDSTGDDDWDKSACLMEMDRLTRILNTKFDAPLFLDRVRAGVSEYINRPAQIRNDMNLGLPHYKIVLTETKNSLLNILNADPKTPKAAEAFEFIIDEMVRMEYISKEDAGTMKSFGTSRPTTQPQERHLEVPPQTPQGG
jgi:hypothetical protein